MNHDTTPQAVRDLQWSLSSPSLIAESESTLNTPADKFDVDPDDLASFLATKPTHRVGAYFENLIHYWLIRIRQVELVAHGLRIRHGNRTVGELDFLFRDETGKLTHLEISVKFYLHCTGGGTDGSQLIGPNATDTFDKKMHRLFAHQLPLSEKTHPDVTVRKAVVKGRIFYHPGEAMPRDLPSRLSAAHLTGSWIRRSESSWIDLEDDADVFQILHRPFWLSPQVAPIGDGSTLTRFELKTAIQEHFAKTDSPLLTSILKRQRHTFREIDRMFIVSDVWPGKHGTDLR